MKYLYLMARLMIFLMTCYWAVLSKLRPLNIKSSDPKRMYQEIDEFDIRIDMFEIQNKRTILCSFAIAVNLCVRCDS